MNESNTSYLINNYHLVSIENIDRAEELTSIKRYPSNPIFVTGNERTGVPKEIMENSSKVVKIEQGPGYGNCLNTSTAMGIIIHDWYKKHVLKRKEMWSGDKGVVQHSRDGKHNNNMKGGKM